MTVPPYMAGNRMTAQKTPGSRRVLITGGGAGIGAATGRLLALRGWRVALLDRDGDVARRTAGEIGAGKARGYQGDVTDSEAIARVLDDMVTAWGGIDDLVNNAACGITPRCWI